MLQRKCTCRGASQMPGDEEALPLSAAPARAVRARALDRKQADCLNSSGIAYATNSKIELAVASKDGIFHDIKISNAEPSRP